MIVDAPYVYDIYKWARTRMGTGFLDVTVSRLLPSSQLRWQIKPEEMPPKKKKQATAEAKSTTRKKKGAKDAPKSGVSLSSKSWTLSGGLSVLPLELIQHILLFLATDCACCLHGQSRTVILTHLTSPLFHGGLQGGLSLIGPTQSSRIVLLIPPFYPFFLPSVCPEISLHY